MQPTEQTKVLEAQSITTLEQARSAIQRGFPLNVLMKHSPIFLRLTEERRELVRQAAPLYKELHSSLPFYAQIPLDDPFWSAYVGSRVVAARELVEAHRNSMARSTAEAISPAA